MIGKTVRFIINENTRKRQEISGIVVDKFKGIKTVKESYEGVVSAITHHRTDHLQVDYYMIEVENGEFESVECSKIY